MKYDLARPTIRTGDLIFFEGQKVFSRLIRAYTGHSASHVGIAWVWNDGSSDHRRVMMIEAREGRGITIRALSVCGKCLWVPMEYEDRARVEMEGFFIKTVGRGNYSWLGILGQVMYPLVGRQRWFDKTFRRPDSAFCSDYAALAARYVGKKVPVQPSPGSLLDWSSDNSDFSRHGGGRIPLKIGDPPVIDFSTIIE